MLKSNSRSLSAAILYHFFYPDDVVSARHFSDFAEELVNRNWDVKVLTSNRYCRYPRKKIPLVKEKWKGMEIYRISRPGFNQAKDLSRIVNSLWMTTGWVLKFLFMPKVDVVIVGSDPQLSQFIFPLLKVLKKQKALVYWCYDLYPEAIIANGAKGVRRLLAQKLTGFMKIAYKSLDLIADIGPCMAGKFKNYNLNIPQNTLTPWALVEPVRINQPDPLTRYELFGEATLGLLYSGNLGKAHDFSIFLELARRIKKKNLKVVFCFACRGNAYKDLKEAVKKDDSNVRLAPFAEESDLERRLNAADIHLVSLKKEWEGIVVPSKFFGSLAAGKPILFAGPESSSIGKWISDFEVGIILQNQNIDDVVQRLLELADNPQELEMMGRKSFEVYHKFFSKKVIMDRWDMILRNLIEAKEVRR